MNALKENSVIFSESCERICHFKHVPNYVSCLTDFSCGNDGGRKLQTWFDMLAFHS